ncbi:hypothetical protein CGCF415_v015556 [Colletotrichum fructicola]|nr:hypothetical protein CGCFRS4_v014754 [Colletotrichum fructicola]KAF4884747.1 hypothetical protein CGCF415_v015556 [Colletotrichum fructicola]KAF4921900.1 hypothetical protein CGCF245_v015491 [Colletotrichum fructicola]
MFYDVYKEADGRQVWKDVAKSIKKVMDVDNTQDAQLINLDDEALANTVIQRSVDFPCGFQEDGASPGGSNSAPWSAVEGGAPRLVPDFVWIRGTSHGLPDLQVVLDINTPTVRGLISKAVRPGLLDFHRDIDNANGDRYAEMKTVCDDPEDHTIRGWYNGSEKVKARILDLKKLTQDQFNDTLDAEEEDGYHEHGQEAGQDGGNFQEYRDSSLDFNKKSSAFVPLEEAPAHGW